MTKNNDDITRIIIIDDQQSIHDDLKKILIHGDESAKTRELENILLNEDKGLIKKDNYHIDSALQGEAGFELVKKAVNGGLPYHLAFVDMRMPPGWDGMKTIEHIWAVDNEIQIVICTAFTDYNEKDIFNKFGQTDRILVLKKPFDVIEVVQVVNNLTQKVALNKKSKEKIEDLERKISLKEVVREILVVDDEPMARELMTSILNRDYVIKEAASTKEVLEVLSKEAIDVVVSDIKMPGEDGLVLLQKITDLHPEVLVVLVTGHGDKQTAIDAVKTGAFDFLEKPFEDDQLELIVKRAVKQIKMRNKLKDAQTQNMLTSKLASIGELSAGIAHEINTPLQIIDLGIKLIKKKYVTDNLDVPENIEKICKSVVRIRDIVNGLRVYARADTEHNDQFNLHKPITESIQLIGNIYKNAGIMVEAELNAKRDEVFGNVGKVQQVIMNFLSNAKDAVGEKNGGVIKFKTENSGDNLVLEISDNGCGIPQENLKKIFDSFFTTKPVGKGTGLGMSISFQIVQSMKGEIKLESKVGEGTKFTIILPLVKA